MDDEIKAHNDAIHELCRDREIKRIAADATITTSGSIKIGDVRKYYTLTKPVTQDGGEGDAAFFTMEGVINVGNNVRSYVVQRHNRKGGFSESFIYVDGKFIGSIKRGHQPRTFENTGSFELNGQAHSFKLRETVNPMDVGAVQFKRDELEALAMMAAM
jgi:hypothetical protein